ncbi:ABC transporter ATP-binding protein [Noviherbaspirillum pedocola]|uniref:ABC transporter ATP-binding protein n=1 Tax=Noviherbaspirillum pedocola TaxID=2801341 RepID=A0A934SZD2_9BURK|nr:ABC transporter ATP-binding protein [Noviherbaspirillum pedocola]MBK4739320.1 ABC transporter ATP-binding protein [Noviherbaspirillum pedocola]
MRNSSIPLVKPPLLSVRDLVCEFNGPQRARISAVSGLSFDIGHGETLALVGESGCGKSTTGRAVMQLQQASSGQVVFDTVDLTRLDSKALRAVRRRMQMVFQDPISSLNPRRAVGDIVAEPLVIAGGKSPDGIRHAVRELLEIVGFDPDAVWRRRPHEFSGGQCQRISLARALIAKPVLLICDEPVSALDVSVQARILNLLEELKERFHFAMLFISHDLSVVRNVSDRVAVMYLGKLCEIGPTEAIFKSPKHPYTQGLLKSILSPHTGAGTVLTEALFGEIPSATSPPSGCRFRTRCKHAQAVCAEREPTSYSTEDGRYVSCHFPSLAA